MVSLPETKNKKKAEVCIKKGKAVSALFKSRENCGGKNIN